MDKNGHLGHWSEMEDGPCERIACTCLPVNGCLFRLQGQPSQPLPFPTAQNYAKTMYKLSKTLFCRTQSYLQSVRSLYL